LNGDLVEVDTTVSVVYTLGEKYPNNAEGSTSPSEVPPPPAELPPAPAALSEVGPPYADSSDGMYKQFVTVLAAWKSGDEQKFKSFRDGFALPDPKAWLAKTFGVEQGATLLAAYEESLKKFNSHIAWVSGNWANAPDLAFGVEPSELPKPPAESGPEAALPIPIVGPRIENFRFRVAGGELGLNEWVFSFVYLDGAFRIVGGTLTFWDEALQRLRAPMSVAGIVSAATLVHQVTPVYPKDAKKQHIEGTVLLRATIGHDGTVENLEYVSGPRELTPSAMEAVKQWRYKPTLLNGEPVEVDTTISVTYTLGNH
jgi:TonB family protein